MSSLKRDTDNCVYIRFQVSEERIESFGKMFTSATKLDFRTSLRGISKDNGNAYITLALSPESNTEPARRKFANLLNATFVKLFDFYPSISEKPAEPQISSALSYLQDTSVVTRAQNPIRPTLRSSLTHSALSH